MKAKILKIIAGVTPTSMLYKLITRVARGTDRYTVAEWFDFAFLVLAILTFAARCVWEKIGVLNPAVFTYLAAVQISRCIEIPSAFLADALDTLRKPSNTKAVPRYRRIELAITVYFELILNYALLYALMPGDYWSAGRCPSLKDLAEIGVLNSNHSLSAVSALYYSAATMSTLGFGDIVPLRNLPRVSSIVQVLSSVILVVMSIAIYAGTGVGQSGGSVGDEQSQS
jgi:hypothetical protein